MLTSSGIPQLWLQRLQELRRVQGRPRRHFQLQLPQLREDLLLHLRTGLGRDYDIHDDRVTSKCDKLMSKVTLFHASLLLSGSAFEASR